MKIIVTLVLFFNLQVLAQDFSDKLSFFFSMGGGFASETEYAISNLENRNIEYVNYSPDLSGKLGITYESIANVYDLNLGLALEIGYISASTSKFDFSLEGSIIQAKVIQRVIPVTLSLILDNDKILSPIIKIGLGLGNKKYSKEYEKFNQANVNAENWFFILIGGAGLTYKISLAFELSLILEATILDGRLSGENKLGFRSGFQGIQTNIYSGLQCSYLINI